MRLNLKKIMFIRPVCIPWAKQELSSPDGLGFFSTLDMESLPDNVAVEMVLDPSTGQPVEFVIKEKAGNRAVSVPAAMVVKYIETSNIDVLSPFKKP
jgi:hypothetical protein